MKTNKATKKTAKRRRKKPSELRLIADLMKEVFKSIDMISKDLDRARCEIHQTHAVQNNFCVRLGYIEDEMGIVNHDHRQYGGKQRKP